MVTATDVAAICGVDSRRYRSAYDVWMKKHGYAPEIQQNMFMKAGNRYEKTMLLGYQEDLALERLEMGWMGVHKDHEWAGATPDGIVTHNGQRWTVEAKWVGQYKAHEWGPSGSGDVPLHFYLQALWQSWVFNTERFDICCVIGGMDSRQYSFRRPGGLLASVVRRCKAFYDSHIAINEEPPYQPSENFADSVIANHTPSAAGELRATKAAEDKLRRLLEIKDQTKKLQSEYKILKGRIVYLLDDTHTDLIGETCRASHRPDKRGIKTFRVSENDKKTK